MHRCNKSRIALSTTAFNQLPAALFQSVRPNTRSRAGLFYDLGIIWAVIGLVLSLSLLVGQAWTVGTSLWAFVSATGSPTGSTVAMTTTTTTSGIASLVKRATPVETTADSGFIKPLIPGITIPFSQALYLILSFLLAQLVHEPGHAISAALSSINPLLMTVQLSPIFPSASVTLPSIELALTPPRERARIAAAGCWHNFLSVIVLGALTLLANQALIPVSHIGRAVLGFQPGSALAQAIPVGSIITHLDDSPLGATSLGKSDKLWSDMFVDRHTDIPGLTSGWCVSEAWFLAQNDLCCKPASTPSSDLTICFNPSASTSSSGRCLPPSIMLPSTQVDSTGRTPQRCPCLASGEICIEPDESKGEIVRITFLSPRSDRSPSGTNKRWADVEESIVWQGPSESIYSQIETSPTIPPSLIPLSLYPQIRSIALLFKYFTVISTTLSIFNLLPLSLLDGGFFLDALLDWGLPGGEREASEPITPAHNAEQYEQDISGDEDDGAEVEEEDEEEQDDDYKLLSRGTQRADNSSTRTPSNSRSSVISHKGRRRRKLKKKIKSSLAGLTIGLGIWVLGGMAVRLALDLHD
ncbi:Intramembrane metalloprotease (sterol-regulatory element-binding protein (SREBP) protease) [Phaffia rhodozyma]|uniref:Endopeptidase S2P n=1 Tax=Phaffia rhodozyma TaxID=264483 RepID=A0A0F7STG1_PHARH|nr:Intramembrane metalloprotease (sterol-regulatory element-binding protein (SREBP) protease) [Phaffia rhodozyma]